MPTTIAATPRSTRVAWGVFSGDWWEPLQFASQSLSGGGPVAGLFRQPHKSIADVFHTERVDRTGCLGSLELR